jgi:hypothetical protein
MGAEIACTARYKGKTTKGKACLENNALEFRGADRRLQIPLSEIKKVSARGGSLTVESSDGLLSLALGGVAEKWAFKIQHPPSRFDKLGVKPEWRVSALGVEDEGFLEELKGTVAHLSIGRAIPESDAILLGASQEAQLVRIAKLKTSLKANGALWVIRPKGRPEISERAVMAAGKAAGLVDVKVVSFSPTHTAEKFVIPVKNR